MNAVTQTLDAGLTPEEASERLYEYIEVFRKIILGNYGVHIVENNDNKLLEGMRFVYHATVDCVHAAESFLREYRGLGKNKKLFVLEIIESLIRKIDYPYIPAIVEPLIDKIIMAAVSAFIDWFVEKFLRAGGI